MRNIVSPLDGFASPFGRRGLSKYAIGNFDPALVADFDDEYYRANKQKTTFDGLLSHSRLSRATMVDSDGLIKWGPHNLALNSASPATQSITVISGADYTVECTGVSIVLSGAGTGTVTEGNPVEITASTTTLTLTVTGSTGTMWCYRSDLGGMVNNPDRGDSYVPTTSSAVYLPRRGHHVWNGSAWVNEGLLHESEARTNLLTYSEDFTNASWSKFRGTVVANQIAAPDGNSTADVFQQNGVAETFSRRFGIEPAVADNTTFTSSIWAKKKDLDWLYFIAFDKAGGSVYGFVNLTSGAKGVVVGTTTVTVEDWGNGWYRVSYTINSGSGGSTFGVYWGLAEADNDASLNDTNTFGTYFWGEQLEAGSTPSSYIPTNGATATRGAETLTVAAADLPWPTPRVIGPELVTNTGPFIDTTGWSKSSLGTISVVGDDLQIVSTNSPEALYTSISVESGKVYKLTVIVNSHNGNGGTFTITSVPASSGTIIVSYSNTTTPITVEGYFVGDATATRYINLFCSNETVVIDNVSVREIDPLSVSIQMDGRMTYSDKGSESQETFVRWYDDASNRIVIDLDTDSTDTGEVNFEQQDGTGGTGTVTADTYSPGVLVPYNVSGRFLSTLVNGATDGTAESEDTTPTALPDLSATDLNLAHTYMGTIRTFRMWNKDLGDTGIEEAST